MSILRSSKFLKYFISFNKNIVTRSSRTIDGPLTSKPFLFATPSFRYLRQAVAPQGGIEKCVQKLDQEVRRSGRIKRKELDDALNELINSTNATSSQSLMIIRCCGNLIPEESPEVRTQLLKKVWTTLEEKGVPLDISHYNVLLRVYIENEYNFSPIEFLADLESKGIEPNRVTFQRLITTYCQKGDIEGATKILEFMKEKQMPVNEAVFCSLITGHFQADDVQSAVGILNVMKQANIKPTSDTYTTLMCGYAKNGDINAINEILAQCETEEIDIADKDLLEVVYSLGINNHTDLIDELIGKLKRNPGYNQDAKNTVLRLVVHGQDAAATKVLYSMTPLVRVEGEPIAVGNFLIKQMVKCNRPVDSIISLCEDLKNSGQNENALAVATETSLICGNPDTSLKLLTALSKEREMCPHFYWPVLVQYGKAGDIEGIKNTLLQSIREVGQAPNGETLRDFVAPYVPKGEVGILEMKNGGASIASASAAMVGHLLMKNHIRDAAAIAMQYRANYSSIQNCRLAVSAFLNTQDLPSFIKLTNVFVANEKEDTEREHIAPADRILTDVFHGLRREGKVQKITKILQAFLDAGIGISSETAEELQNLLNGNELTTEISTLLTKLTSPELVLLEIERPESARKSMNFLQSNEEVLLASIARAKETGESAYGQKRQLLSYYCVNKELEKAEALFKELEADNFEFVTGTLVHLMELYIHYENLAKALEIYNRIFPENSSMQIDASKIIKLGGLMIHLGKLDDAFNLFTKHSFDHELSQRGFNANSVGWRLLNNLADKQDPELIKTVFDKLVETGLIEANNITLGPLIKVHILRNDIDSAMEQFEECCKKYRSTPWKNELSCRLIEKEDPILLQKLTDLSTDIHGEINSLYDLVLSFIECGRIRQARKILETPGLRLRNQRINSACERYNSEGKVNYLENLVEATKDLTFIDRSDIYYYLLLSYCKSDDVDKALGLWTQMQDEDVQPSDLFLKELASILQKHNRPVPFAVPHIPEPIDAETKTTVANSKIRDFRKIINSKNSDEALQLLCRLNEEDLSIGDRSRLLMLLNDNGRLGEACKIMVDWLQKGLPPSNRVISEIVNSLAKIGDVETLKNVEGVLDKDQKRFSSYSNRYAHCMVEAGRVDELLSKLEGDINSASTEEEIEIIRESFPKGGIFSVLDSAPDSIPRVEKIAALYREKGLFEPTNALWSYNFSKGNFEKAMEFWGFLNKDDIIMYHPILKQVRSSNDVALAWDLLNLFKKSKVSVNQLGSVYSVLIDVENKAGNLQECERILDAAVNECSINSLPRGVIFRLKKSFEASGKTLKYSLPSTKMFRQRTKDSSTSSDSDSDSETARKPRARI